MTRRAVLGGFVLALAAPRSAGAADEASPGVSEWSVLAHGRVRLIDAGASPRDAAHRLVGIQVELDPGYLTYWHSPGEAGLPPSVSFAGSTGFKGATLLFPAPSRYSEAGTEVLGYKDSVVFPVLVVPEDAKKPVGLRMHMDFAICERQCLPAKADAVLTVEGAGAGAEAGLVRDALARVPVLAKLDEPGPLQVVAVQGNAGDSVLQVTVKARGADVPLLFAEAPDPWFVQAGEGLWSNDGTLSYKVAVEARPVDPAPLPLRLTLVGVDGAIEVPVTLAMPPPQP